jgi:putative transposase
LAQEPKSEPQKGWTTGWATSQGAKKKLKKWRAGIEKGETVVLFLDECHLVHGDAQGYAWGKVGERIEIPMLNERRSQTYYGALELLEKTFHVLPYDRANGANTVDFVQCLGDEFPHARRIVLIWDGAPWHRHGEMKAFLESINGGLKKNDWTLHCLLFAPNAPEQNPVEDCWLKAKNYVRQHLLELKSFKQVCDFFIQAFKELSFDFNKINWYY